MSAQDELAALAAECHYSDEGGFDDEGNDLGSVDALIDYKNALEEGFTKARTELLDLHRMLFPERYPQDAQPDHIYWAGDAEGSDEPFQWSSDTIEWVAEALQRALADHPDARLTP